MNVVVTGASKGIGKAICLLLCKKQANLAICSRDINDLKSLKKELNELYPGGQVLVQACDVSKQEDLIDFSRMILSSWAQVDVLINNAGIFIPGQIHNEEEGVLEKMVETNLYSAYHLTRLLIPSMIENKSGHVFNMCSVASQIAYPNGGSYSISKFALLGFSKVLREELKEKGIKVTSILPGATWSNSWEGVDLPRERLMEAEDIARAVWSAIQMSPSAVVEEILIRPLLGDL